MEIGENTISEPLDFKIFGGRIPQTSLQTRVSIAPFQPPLPLFKPPPPTLKYAPPSLKINAEKPSKERKRFYKAADFSFPYAYPYARVQDKISDCRTERRFI